MKIISETEFEVTVETKTGKLFTVYSSVGNPMELMLTLLYREASVTVGTKDKLTAVLARSLEDTNPTFVREAA